MPSSHQESRLDDASCGVLDLGSVLRGTGALHSCASGLLGERPLAPQPVIHSSDEGPIERGGR